MTMVSPLHLLLMGSRKVEFVKGMVNDVYFQMNNCPIYLQVLLNLLDMTGMFGRMAQSRDEPSIGSQNCGSEASN